MLGLVPLIVGVMGVVHVIGTYRRWPISEDILWQRNVKRYGVSTAIELNYIRGAALVVCGFGGFVLYNWRNF